MDKIKFDLFEGFTNMFISALFLANALKLFNFDLKLFLAIWFFIIIIFATYRFIKIKKASTINLLKLYCKFFVADGIIIFIAALLNNVFLGWIGIGIYIFLGCYGCYKEFNRSRYS